ncbi:MAG: hypothetical protein A2Y28_05080 [Chlamydiae bacterium GWC2_50_10]|nr:MAG: hypothetical protein A2Z85_02255 [Chlamydiae bacterium GWA2_50_15]OGN54333.1 MAG: hypothetical protein A2Y28_05080 [Chlamydiae bacterium GWC2_50_10]OGN71678.1 MAG: hypothetical protein A3I15_02310 [Chlamydiae bacterium RIFCSPLOWO2_02_FULL_49_12]OGN75244.1 MAG: hypothetical protein A3G30_05425 [Chlamydiae bacterium RIFCSPLOWO2_12_FULL_49_12]HAZ15506.1 1-acyl-sn-glycerol-3-phosphate acyltransferase [Parachlamydiales bacterium]
MSKKNKGHFLYRTTIALFRFFFKLCYRLKIYGLEHHFTGGALIASNHASFFDPPLLAVAWPEEVYFLARETLFNIPLFGRFIYALNARPVRGTAKDIAVFKLLCSLLEEEKKIILFPEGSRALNNRLGPLKQGASFLILRTHKAIIPAYIHGTYDVWNRKRKFPKLFGKISCIFGSPLRYQEFASLEKKAAEAALTQRLKERILALKEWFEAGAQGSPP